MLIIYYLFVFIAVYFLLKFSDREGKIKKLSEFFYKKNKLIFIISDDKCRCNKTKIYKCKKCRVKGVINIENIDELMNMMMIIDQYKVKNVHLIIHSEGGECGGVDAISRLLSESKIRVKTYIPQYAYSAGTMMSICGRSIFMNWYSLLGPVDTQLDYDEEDTFSAKHIKEFKKKSWAKEKDYLKGLEAESVHNDDEHILSSVLKRNKRKDNIIKCLLNTKYSHDMSYNREDIKKMGLPVIGDVPPDMMSIFLLYKKLF